MEIKPLSKRRILSLILSVILLITALALPVSAAPHHHHQKPAQPHPVNKVAVTGTADYKAAYDVLKLVNAERKKLGRPALVMDKATMDAAMQRAAECSVYYSHMRPNGDNSYTVLDWKYTFGENIAVGQTAAKEVVTDWMNSPSHKANIIDSNYYETHRSFHRYTSIGIGVFKVGDVYFWCQLFNGAEKKADPTTKKAVTKTFNVEIKSKDLKLSIDQKKLTLDTGKSATLHISNANKGFLNTTIPLAAKGFRYSSSNEKVATVSTTGKVTAVGIGSAKITVKCQDGRSLFTIPVAVKNEKVDAAIAVTAKGVTISWGKVTGATTYKIYKSVYKSGKWQKATLAASTKALSYSDNKLKSGEKAKYTVYAYAGKKEFKSHDTVTGMYLAQPKVKVAKASAGAKLTWGKVAGATTYKVYRSTYSGGKWSAYKVYTTTKKTSYADKKVKAGQKVRYIVYAVNGSYKSAEKATTIFKR